MADNTITHGAPGIAEFDSESWGNVKEVRLQQNPPFVARRATISNGGAEALTLPIWSVVSLTGLAVNTGGNSDAVGILPAPIVIPAGGSVEMDLIVAGYYDYDALNWDASFATEADKRAAFDGRPAPTNIVLDTNPYNSDGVLA